jgi:hypothetical protein
LVHSGIAGLRDAPRSGLPPKHDANVRHQVQTRVCQQPEDQSRWTVRTLAAELKLPASTVHGMLVAARLQPHRVRTFTFSPDPDFESKLLDIVGLYLNPPENALVLCVDEKPSIQALECAAQRRGMHEQSGPIGGSDLRQQRRPERSRLPVRLHLYVGRQSVGQDSDRAIGESYFDGRRAGVRFARGQLQLR